MKSLGFLSYLDVLFISRPDEAITAIEGDVKVTWVIYGSSSVYGLQQYGCDSLLACGDSTHILRQLPLAVDFQVGSGVYLMLS